MASGVYSHAEGESTFANGYASHVEGYYTSININNSESKGAHAEGMGTVAHGNGQHVQGRYNVEEGTMDGGYPSFAHIQGWGSSGSRKNIHTLDKSGNAAFAGDIYV